MKSPTRRAVAAAAAVAALVAGTWPTYAWWAEHRTADFKARCEAASEARRWDELEATASRWTKWDPASGDAWLYLAEAAQEQGNPRRASDCLAEVPQSDPRCVQALVHRVEILFRDLNAPREAAATCRKILSIDPLIAVARQRLIFIDAMTLQRRDMVHEIREAIRLRREPPEAYVYLFGSDWIHFSNGYVVNSHWLEGASDDEMFEVARAYHLAASGEEAVDPLSGSQITGDLLMTRCLEKYPRNLEVLAYFADKAIADGDADRVVELLALLPEEAADDNRFWRHKGWVHAGRGETAEAEQAYRQALALNPYDWKSRHELAAVLRRLGETAEADRMARLAADGKILGFELAQIPNASAVTAEHLERMAAFAEEVGDPLVVSGLEFRLSPPAGASW